MKMNLVLLPATEPDDTTYGVTPERVVGWPDESVHRVKYPHLVWYNRRVRDEAIAQIQALNVSPVILTGFSKSGLGAWNIARSIPRLVCATIIFDAPVTRESLPPWGTAPFYDNDLSWQEDLPSLTIPAFKLAMPEAHRLVLISGQNFHDEMCQLSEKLSSDKVTHAFLRRPHLAHHWDSGWVEEGLSEILE